jgi:hypothetical protein
MGFDHPFHREAIMIPSLAKCASSRGLSCLAALAAVALAGCADGDPVTGPTPLSLALPSFDIGVQSHGIATITSNAFVGERDALEADFTPPIAELPGGVVAGEVVHVGRGCPEVPGEVEPEDPYLADPAGRLALIQRGACRFDNKIARAQIAGATGVIVYGFDGDDALFLIGGESPVQEGSPSVIGTVITIPAVFVGNSTGVALRDGTPPVIAEVTAASDPTPEQMLDHVYQAVDILVILGFISEGVATSLRAQLDAVRGHLERGNLDAAAQLLDAFVSHVNGLEAGGVLTEAAAELLRSAVADVLDTF